MKEYDYIINGKSYHVVIRSMEGDRAEVQVNGEAYQVEIPTAGPDAPVGQPASHAMPQAQAAPLQALRTRQPKNQELQESKPENSQPQNQNPQPENPGPQSRTDSPEPRPQTARTVDSPLPGILVEVNVKEGQYVRAGDKVAVLEAMKMENEIQAPADGTVTAVHVRQGDSVLEGTPIVTIA